MTPRKTRITTERRRAPGRRSRTGSRPTPSRSCASDRRIRDLLRYSSGPSTPRGRSRSSSGSRPERRERRHRRAGRLAARVLEVVDLPLDASALRAFGRQVGRAEVLAARAEVDVAVEAARLGEQRRALRRRPGCRRSPAPSAHSGTRPTVSEPSASFAVAPFQVSTPIEMTTRIAATNATGRRRTARSGRRSKNGSPIRSTSRSVGTPTVPSTTVSGHLKMRSR